MSTFNWENGASNSGGDANYTNDNRIPSLIGVPWNDKDKSGATGQNTPSLSFNVRYRNTWSE